MHDNTENLEQPILKNNRSKLYKVKISEGDLDFKKYSINDPIVTGRQLLKLTNNRPIDQYLLFMLCPNGKFDEIQLEQTVDLRIQGLEQFIVFDSATSFRFVINGERYEWGTKLITGLKLKTITGLSNTKDELWLEKRGSKDIIINDEDFIDLSQEGLERFFTKKPSPKKITIIINTREKTLCTTELSFLELINLAFENPPSGSNVCFTVVYRRGHTDKPEGSLIEGQSIRIVEGMIFNVTSTDKS